MTAGELSALASAARAPAGHAAVVRGARAGAARARDGGVREERGERAEVVRFGGESPGRRGGARGGAGALQDWGSADMQTLRLPKAMARRGGAQLRAQHPLALKWGRTVLPRV